MEVEKLKEDLIKRFPEIDPALWDKYENLLDESVWGAYFKGPYNKTNKEIILNLIAHLVTIGDQGQFHTARPVASQSVGSVSVSYEGYSGEGFFLEFFGSTKYGMHFIYLVSLRRKVAFV